MNRRRPEFMPLRFSGLLARQVSLRARRAGRRALGKTLKMLPLAVAIIDDLLAIVVIAIFYTEELSTLGTVAGCDRCGRLATLSLFDVR
jgi:Na+/H+ antiporter 1